MAEVFSCSAIQLHLQLSSGLPVEQWLSPKTVNDVLTVVRGVWADAKSNDLISNDHMKGIHNHKVKYKGYV